MEKVIKSKEFIEFENGLNEFIKKLNEVKNDINVDVKTKYNLGKYEQIIEGSDSDVLTQYETWYDQLAEVVINKNGTIKQIKNVIKHFNEFIKIEKKEIDNNDEIKITLNSLVDKMIDKETFIFNKKQDELKRQADQIKHEFDEKMKELNGMKYPYDTDVRNSINELFPNDTRIQQDKEIEELIPSFNKLREWSGKQKCSILFDSQIDGDGSNNVLMNKVVNKKNLYFITFDNQNNVFGGYVNTTINKTGSDVTDPNSFTFSLIRTGELKNIKYNIKNDHQQNAFYLTSNSDKLYGFGNIFNSDIGVYKIGNSSSYCKPHSYEYNGDQHPFNDNNLPTKFAMKRILVIQMN